MNYIQGLGDSLDRRFQHFVSHETMDSSMINAASDELKLRAVEDINNDLVGSPKSSSLPIPVSVWCSDRPWLTIVLR